MEKYHIYVIIAFLLGICIKLYDDFTDFENLKIPTFHTDILKMMIFMLNTIISIYDYRFSFIPIFAVLSSYVADKLKNTFINEFINKSLEKSIEHFKNTKIWNKLDSKLQIMIWINIFLN